MKPSTTLLSHKNVNHHKRSDCPLCRSSQQTDYRQVDSYRIVRCDQCHFLFVSPLPSQEELAAFYQQPTYYEGSDLGYDDYLGDRHRHEQLARGRLRRIASMHPGRGAILDVGCAAGFFLSVAQSHGWQTAGIELSSSMADYATQLLGHQIAPTLTDSGVQPESLDAVTLWEYIEHIPDPQDEITRLVALLKPGGVLALSTPNTNYWVAVHQPDRWREYKPPAHVGFFTPATLQRMLETGGLEQITIVHATPRAPTQPYLLQRLLLLLRDRVGNGADRRTPLWWSFSLAWRLGEYMSQVLYRVRWPGCDLHIGLEAYAIKPKR